MFYKLTVKINNKRYPGVEEYTYVISKIELKGMKMVEWHYEIDSNCKLHLHALCEARSNYYLKKVIDSFEGTGTHIMLERFKRNSEHDIGSWLRYIRKDEATIDADLKYYYQMHVLPERKQETDRIIKDSTDAYRKRLTLGLDL